MDKCRSGVVLQISLKSIWFFFVVVMLYVYRIRFYWNRLRKYFQEKNGIVTCFNRQSFLVSTWNRYAIIDRLLQSTATIACDNWSPVWQLIANGNWSNVTIDRLRQLFAHATIDRQCEELSHTTIDRIRKLIAQSIIVSVTTNSPSGPQKVVIGMISAQVWWQRKKSSNA